MILQSILLAINSVWTNAFFYLFVSEFIIALSIILNIMKLLKERTNERKLIQQQQIAKIDNIRKDHSDTLENLRLEMLKREEERTRQWIESEKETLHVLNGVSVILELSEKVLNAETGKMQNIMIEIRERIEKIEKLLESNSKNNNEQENRETQGS
jgi:c-di-AMP phosphodiesterase-like protein